MAADDVASGVGRIAVGSPVNGIVEIGGPEQFRLDELVRRRLATLKDPREVIADPHARYSGAEVGERTLVPGKEARLGETRFELGSLSPQQKRRRSPTSGSVKERPICVNRPHSNQRFIYDHCKTGFDAGLSDVRHTGTQRRESDAALSKDLTDFPARKV